MPFGIEMVVPSKNWMTNIIEHKQAPGMLLLVNLGFLCSGFLSCRLLLESINRQFLLVPSNPGSQPRLHFPGEVALTPSSSHLGQLFKFWTRV